VVNLNITPPWLTIVSVHKDDSNGLSRTLASVRIQDLIGVEHTIIDSSRNPVTESDLDRIAPKLHKVDLEWSEPRGVYAAMNLGIQGARGKYTLFLNAGDVFHSGSVVSSLRQSVYLFDPLWLYGRVNLVDASGEHRPQKSFNYSREYARKFRSGRFPQQPGMLVRTDLLRDLGGFNEIYRIASDYEFMLRLSQVAEPMRVEFVITDFKTGGLSTTNWRKSLMEACRARETVYELGPAGRIAERFRSIRVYVRAFGYRLFR